MKTAMKRFVTVFNGFTFFLFTVEFFFKSQLCRKVKCSSLRRVSGFIITFFSFIDQDFQKGVTGDIFGGEADLM